VTTRAKLRAASALWLQPSVRPCRRCRHPSAWCAR